MHILPQGFSSVYPRFICDIPWFYELRCNKITEAILLLFMVLSFSKFEKRKSAVCGSVFRKTKKQKYPLTFQLCDLQLMWNHIIKKCKKYNLNPHLSTIKTNAYTKNKNKRVPKLTVQEIKFTCTERSYKHKNQYEYEKTKSKTTCK